MSIIKIISAFLKSIFDNEYDLNNSTFEEKVLEDGTVVRINRYSVMKSDGNSFLGDVVLDRFINAYRDKDNILNQTYENV